MHPLALDIRNLCHSIMPGWVDDGMWGNKIEIKGYVMRAQGHGGAYTPSQLAVYVQRLNPSTSSLPFCRILDRDGSISNEKGNLIGSTPYSSDWMKESIHEALTWISQNPI